MKLVDLFEDQREVLYHGSDSAEIKGELRVNERDAGWFGQGFYLTAYDDYAKRWGKYVYKVEVPAGKYAHVKVTGNYDKVEYEGDAEKANEYAGGHEGWVRNEVAWAKKFNEFLVNNGNIGIRVTLNGHKNSEVVVFNPKNLKFLSSTPIKP